MTQTQAPSTTADVAPGQPVPRRRRRLAAVLLVAVATGLLAGALWPLGPVTTAQAVAVMALGLGLGLLTGRATGSTWPVAAVAALHLVGVEVARWDLTLPTVDAVRFDSVYGVLALLVGRGLHLLLLGLPMLLGGRLAASPRWRGGARRPRRSMLLTAVVAVLTVALVALVVRPASTPDVVGADGEPVAGSVATLERVRLGGDEHTVMLRAADPDAPVLLYLSGGPGQSDLALARVLSEPWVDDVVFATYDQRGNGTSYPALLPTDEATLAQAVDDTVELAQWLADRFGESKVILMGESWGTLLGVLAVQQRPDLFHAWIGSGQMVDVAETDRRIYDDLRRHAADTGDAELTADLRRIGEPPYRDIPWANASVMNAYGLLYDEYTPSPGYLERGRASGLDPFGVLGTEYALVDKANVLRGLIDTFTVMYPQIQDVDLREDAARLEVPVYLLDGAAELDGRRDLALQWFAELDAPLKRRVTYQDAAHAVAFEQADAVEQLLVNEVLLPGIGGR